MGKKDLWGLTKDSLHVKFYQWLWGIYAPSRYKTACPYYWAYGASILILPIILLAKIIALVGRPIVKYFENRSEIKMGDNLKFWVLRAKNATTDIELYKIFKSKCFQLYRWNPEFEEVNQKIIDGYKAHKEVLRKAKELRQAKIDAFKYGPIGIILTYVIGFIILALIGWGIYYVASLITWPEFKQFSLVSLFILTVVFIIFATIAGASKVYDNYVCNTWFGKLRPLKWFAWPFKILWVGVCMFADMVKSIYTKSCPRIDWK